MTSHGALRGAKLAGNHSKFRFNPKQLAHTWPLPDDVKQKAGFHVREATHKEALQFDEV